MCVTSFVLLELEMSPIRFDLRMHSDKPENILYGNFGSHGWNSV